jgi:hypothetical protein
MPFRGTVSATSATIEATSSAAIGWNETGGSLTESPSAAESAMPPTNSRKLGRANNGVGDAGGLDQFLLGEFRAKIAIVGPVDCDDGKRDVVPDARYSLRREKIAP